MTTVSDLSLQQEIPRKPPDTCHIKGWDTIACGLLTGTTEI